MTKDHTGHVIGFTVPHVPTNKNLRHGRTVWGRVSLQHTIFKPDVSLSGKNIHTGEPFSILIEDVHTVMPKTY